MKITEKQEQQKFISWLRWQKIFHFAPINENQHSFKDRKLAIIQERTAKTMGKIKGVSDVIVLLDKQILFIELKRKGKILKNGSLSVKGIKVSKEQEEFLREINKFYYASGKICYGADEAINYVKEHL